jgi:O-antigen/teichoic acid export membrane protein
MSIRKQAISGVKWTTVSTITLTVVNLLKIFVLARFLDKTDFGLMALVTFVLGFMNLFMDMGLTSAILHRQDISKQEYASLYWINVFISIALAAIIILFSPLIAGFYNEPELNILIPLMSVSIIFSALGRQFRTIEQKELHFKYLGIIDIISAVCGLAVGVIMAVMGFGVYALVFGSLIIYGVSNMVFLIKGLATHGMLFHFNYKETKPFLGIGIYQVGGQIINYFNRDLDVLIIGKFFGTEILGGYSLAKQLVRRPLQIIDPIITKVGVSIFPKYQNNHVVLRKYFTKLINAKGSINALVYGAIAILAPYLVQIFYGNDFMSIVPYVQLFAMLVYLRSMGGIMGILVITTGRTDYEFYWNLITTLLMPIAIILGAMHSVIMIIILMTFVQLILLIPGWYMFYKRLINLEFLPFFKSNLIPALIAAVFVILTLIVFKNNLVGEIFMTAVLFVSLFIYSYLSLKEVKELTTKIIRKYARF